MAANFGLNPPTAEKAVFAYRTRKKLAVFPSKVQTLLLSKNLGYENIVSLALQIILSFHLADNS